MKRINCLLDGLRDETGVINPTRYCLADKVERERRRKGTAVAVDWVGDLRGKLIWKPHAQFSVSAATRQKQIFFCLVAVKSNHQQSAFGMFKVCPPTRHTPKALCPYRQPTRQLIVVTLRTCGK